jgi:co-chaperonin GroES (HSP10)
MIVKPLKDKIIVKPEPRLNSTLDLSLMQEADSIGTVVALGDEAQDQGLNIGDRVLFGTLAKEYKDEYLKFDEINLNGERHLKMSWQDIAAVME